MNAQRCFANEDEATNWALDWLGARGFLISKPVLGEMLSPATLRRRHAPHLDASGFHRRLKHRHCPPFLHVRAKGDHGRLLELSPTPELIAWLARPAEPGVRALPLSTISQSRQSGSPSLVKNQGSELRLLGNTPREKESTDDATPGPQAGVSTLHLERNPA